MGSMGSMGSDVRISDTFEQAAPESSNKPRHSLVTGLATNPLRGLLHGVEVDVQAELRGSVVGDLTAHLRDVHELHAEQTVLDEFLHQLRAVLTSVGAGEVVGGFPEQGGDGAVDQGTTGPLRRAHLSGTLAVSEVAGSVRHAPEENLRRASARRRTSTA